MGGNCPGAVVQPGRVQPIHAVYTAVFHVSRLRTTPVWTVSRSDLPQQKETNEVNKGMVQ